MDKNARKTGQEGYQQKKEYGYQPGQAVKKGYQPKESGVGKKKPPSAESGVTRPTRQT